APVDVAHSRHTRRPAINSAQGAQHGFRPSMRHDDAWQITGEGFSNHIVRGDEASFDSITRRAKPARFQNSHDLRRTSFVAQYLRGPQGLLQLVTPNGQQLNT